MTPKTLENMTEKPTPPDAFRQQVTLFVFDRNTLMWPQMAGERSAREFFHTHLANFKRG